MTDLVGNYLRKFTIKIDDHYYYVAFDLRFDNFNDLPDMLAELEHTPSQNCLQWCGSCATIENI